jgi:tetratricopeptide (TPR) repeat protein
VDYVLSGTVERHGEHARLSAHLISATTGRQVWAEIYDRDLQAIPALHAMMSQIIARELHVQITPKEQVRLSRVRPVNRDAYEAYLKGRYYQAKRTGDGLTKSIAYFQEAVSKDPGYGQAYAGFADTYTYMANHGFLPPRDAAPRAKAMAAKALEIDDTLAEGHTSIAYIRMVYDWDWPGAEREFRRSIELDPSYAKAHSLFACYFALLRRFDEAIGEVRQALELDPLSIYDNTNFGWHAVCRAPVHRGHRSISEDAGHGSGQCPDAFLSWASVGTGGVVRRSYRRIPKGHKPDRRHSCHFRRACPCLRAIRQCS